MDFIGFEPYEKLKNTLLDNCDLAGLLIPVLDDVAFFRGSNPYLCLAAFDFDNLHSIWAAGHNIQNVLGSKYPVNFHQGKPAYFKMDPFIGQISEGGSIRLVAGYSMQPGKDPILFFDVMSIGHLSFGYNSLPTE